MSMNLRSVLSLAALVGLFSVAHADPVLLNDNFNGSAINTANWDVTTPFSDSSVTVNSGSVKLSNGAGIISDDGYTAPIEVLFSFAFTGNTHDSFRLYTRVDDFRPTGYHVAHGVGVSFRIREDTGNPFGNVALEDSSGTLVTGTFALTAGTFYTGRLIDTGTGFAFYWGADINPFLTATSSEHFGDDIAAWNREGAGNGSFISAGSQMSIDYITVLSVPDTGTTVLLTGLALLGLVAIRKRQMIASLTT